MTSANSNAPAPPDNPAPANVTDATAMNTARVSSPLNAPNSYPAQIAKGKTTEETTAKAPAIKPGSRRPSHMPVESTKVTYGDFDLSKKAIEYRKTHDLLNSTGNIAVFEYEVEGVRHTEIAVSKPYKLHSEEEAWTRLHEKGVTPDQVKRIYTEREPCSLPAHNCGGWLGQELPNAEVYHSFDYGDTKSSRESGNAALESALEKIREGTK